MALSPIRRTWPECSITARAARIGLRGPQMPATAPAERSRPSMTAASISCLPGGCIDGAASGIEERLVLERHHGGGHRIERAAAIGENDASSLQGAAQAGMIGSLPLGRHLAAQDRAGAAVDGQGEIDCRERLMLVMGYTSR